MSRGRLIRIFLITTGVLIALFLTAITLGGGPRVISVDQPALHPHPPPATPASATANLTAAATQTIARELAASDDLSKKTVPPTAEQIATNALQQTLASFDPESFFPFVQSANFIVTADRSRQAGQAYLADLLAILKNTGRPLASSSADSTQPDFAAAFARYDTALQQLSALAVPSPLIEIHRQAVKIIGAQHNIFAALQNHAADPLRALLAAQSEALVTQRLDALAQDIQEYLISQQTRT